MKAFAHLNIDRIGIAWEVAIGRINAEHVTEDMRWCTSLWLFSILKTLSKNIFAERLFFEYELELYRYKFYPNAVSRLTGVFLFETKKEAEETVNLWGWEEKYISEIEFNPTNITKVDSDWITYCGSNKDKKWKEKYWGGQPYSENPHWEIIAEGSGKICNYELREKAFQSIFEKQPTTTPFLSPSICAFEANEKFSRISMIKPFLMLKDNKLIGCFVMEGQLLKDNQKEIRYICLYYNFLNKLKPIKFKDGETMSTLDLSDENFEIVLDEIALKRLRLIGIGFPNQNNS